MSGLLNISGTAVNEDPSFRYKMPRLVGKIEGRGNGIKTIVVNMEDIATSINRPPSLPTKFFGCELGAQTRWEEDVQKATVNGAHTTQVLQHLLNVFIDKFVLCPKCHLPETALVVKKGLVQHKCSACGAKEPVDMSHKLCTFILKEATAATSASAPSKEERRAAKKAAKAAVTASGGAAGADGAGDKSEKKVKKDKKEKKDKKDKKDKGDSPAPTGGAAAAPAPGSKKAAEDEEDDEEDEEDEDEDDEADAPAAAAAAAGGDGDGDEDDWETLEDTVVALREFLGSAPSPSTDAVVAEVRRLQVATASPATARAALLARAALDGHEGAAATSAHLAAAVATAARSPRTRGPLRALLYGKDAPALAPSQAALLAAVTRVIARHADALLRATPVLLQALYEGDVLEEDAVVAWAGGRAGGAAAAPVKAAAEPFISWLTEADEESDDDGGDE